MTRSCAIGAIFGSDQLLTKQNRLMANAFTLDNQLLQMNPIQIKPVHAFETDLQMNAIAFPKSIQSKIANVV